MPRAHYLRMTRAREARCRQGLFDAEHTRLRERGSQSRARCAYIREISPGFFATVRRKSLQGAGRSQAQHRRASTLMPLRRRDAQADDDYRPRRFSRSRLCTPMS